MTNDATADVHACEFEQQLEETRTKLEAARGDRETMRGALEHIANVCKGSRQSTRRIRWIEARARSAIAGDENWHDVQLPKHEPGIELLQNMIVSIIPIVLDEIEARRDCYEGDDNVVHDEQIGRELEILDRFVRDAKHHIQVIREMLDRRAVRGTTPST